MGLLWKFFAVSTLCVASLNSEATEKVFFPREKMRLAGKVIEVEVARTRVQHERGLMFRKNLPENEGMLFVFPDEDTRSFWMKNTYIDLSIAYFDKNKAVVDIQEMKATSVMESQFPSYPSARPAMYALEMNMGWFKKNKVKVGQKFRFSKQ